MTSSFVPIQAVCEPTRTMTFSEAAPLWLSIHQRHIGTGTLRHYRNCIRALMPVFRLVRLSDIRATHFEEYQKHRRAGTAGMRRAGPSLINHELNTLSQILDRVGLWASIKDHYDPLKLPRPKAGRALSPEEERRLFRIASSNPRLENCLLLRPDHRQHHGRTQRNPPPATPEHRSQYFAARHSH